MLTSEEEDMIAMRLIFAAKRVLTVRKDSLKSAIAQIASDERPNWSRLLMLNSWTVSQWALFFKTVILRRFLFTVFLFLSKDLSFSRYCIWAWRELIGSTIREIKFNSYCSQDIECFEKCSRVALKRIHRTLAVLDIEAVMSSAPPRSGPLVIAPILI